jgi:Ni/Co efflux regulator RcnB
MKRALIAGCALLTALAGSAASAQPYGYGRHGGYGYDHRYDRDYGRGYYDGYYGRGYHRGYGYGGHHRWARGHYLPRSYYGARYDWRYHRLPPPPRGYYYYRDDRSGDVLLAAVATGLIVSILANQAYY